MTGSVTIYYSLNSPWTYLAWQRLRDLVQSSGADARYRPINVLEAFKVSGGLPLAERPRQRQAYRLMELRRWRDHLQVPLHLEPRYFPADERLAAGMVIALGQRGGDMAALSHAFLRAVWAQERDLADPATLVAITGEQGLGSDLLDAAQSQAVTDAHRANTEAAIAEGVFGVPTFVIGEELFWGQDRLDFVARALQGQVRAQAPLT
ncbi:MAG: 2-hydroxychromene-2-carboxylate isomerase [Geminicoccales bacterium]